MSDRRAWLWRLAPGLLILVLAVALVAGSGPRPGLEMANPAAATGDLARVLDGLPDEGLVLVGFDPDLGTYAEIRPTVRALLADLLDRGTRLAFVSLTPEGRALAIVERERMVRAGAVPDRLIDIGFVPGAEAALVALARQLADGSADGIVAGLPEAIASEDVAMGLVIGGNDLGPRSWVEQFRPRTDAIPLVAVTPSVLLPELRPYLASGQLAALVATPRDGAAYRATLDLGAAAAGLVDEDGPAPLAILVGLLTAIAVLGTGVGARLADGLRQTRGRETP
jgi:hypothetical protein